MASFMGFFRRSTRSEAVSARGHRHITTAAPIDREEGRALAKENR